MDKKLNKKLIKSHLETLKKYGSGIKELSSVNLNTGGVGASAHRTMEKVNDEFHKFNIHIEMLDELIEKFVASAKSEVAYIENFLTTSYDNL